MLHVGVRPRQQDSVPDALAAAACDAAQLARATESLRETHPELSAGAPGPAWQKVVLAACIAALMAGALLAPRTTVTALLAALQLPFLAVVLLRSLALLLSRAPEPEPGAVASVPRPGPRRDTIIQWPRYSILVPLFRETAAVPSLVRALGALDYPADRLDIVLVLEASDPETLLAVAAVALPGNMRVVTVPDGLPRTKPKALDYALALTDGDLVVVYDAEDRPEPDQLKRAVAAFAAAAQRGERLGCVQARLNIYNADESWLTRQFAIEYTALFDCMLPALQRAGIPVPLGGTSNHFPRAVLDEAGAWDPFNVTEDADLGIRLARRGWRVAVLPSTTWEEAPDSFAVWKGQRTRWLKGWMQLFVLQVTQLNQYVAHRSATICAPNHVNLCPKLCLKAAPSGNTM